ncbi:Helix-turn-helix protein [Streptomyces sp. YIM 130001]|uniref:helix-turn-helix domain-containing protein n=1 Tax=Streptomyces sp. YIM 130001 TaxID=2259644 RepID=UPI000E64659F|nr:helix-turn-helix transcriptional regulator [Streptomyces sp. YIM 130001]RII18442.1 Helix-turn-helix protein [Streptomyces sp. YIM 130001]
MPEGFSAGGPPAAGAPASLVARVVELAERLGVSRDEILDPERLSGESGVPAGAVRDLLDGGTGGEGDLQTRFLQRFELLRRTRLKANGRPYTQQEIADGAGMSRQQAGALIHGDRRPTMEHCAAIQRFFEVHAGFLTAEDPEALADCLRRTEQDLLLRLAESDGEVPVPATELPVDPLQRILQDHGVRGIAWRAAQLPSDKHRDKVTEWLDLLLENVRRNDP